MGIHKRGLLLWGLLTVLCSVTCSIHSIAFGDTVEIVSITPVPGTVLQVGQQITITARIAYDLTSRSAAELTISFAEREPCPSCEEGYCQYADCGDSRSTKILKGSGSVHFTFTATVREDACPWPEYPEKATHAVVYVEILYQETPDSWRVLTQDEVGVYPIASDYNISGIVYYSTMPLSGVIVELVEGEVTNLPLQSTTTDNDGFYRFFSVAPGDYWVKAYGLTSEYIGWFAQPVTLASSPVIQNIDLPKKINLLSPEHDAVVTDLHPTLSWQANREATRYAIQVNVTDDWQLVDTGEITFTTYTVQHALTTGVNYTWQVDAVDSYGHHVGTTEMAFRFTVVKPGAYTVSTPGTPTGPSSGQVGETLTFFTGGSTCSQGHPVQYRFDWGNGNYSNWSSSTSASHSYSTTGTYQVRAQARCASDTSFTSDWSSGKSVVIVSGGIQVAKYAFLLCGDRRGDFRSSTEDLKSALTTWWQVDHIRVFESWKRTKADLENELKQWCQEPDNDDLLIFYYTGHGLFGLISPVFTTGEGSVLYHPDLSSTYLHKFAYFLLSGA